MAISGYVQLSAAPSADALARLLYPRMAKASLLPTLEHCGRMEVRQIKSSLRPFLIYEAKACDNSVKYIVFKFSLSLSV